ncbi:MAG: pyridoxal phosphate-dependent aminotransferase [Nanoarchaeota archaeon]
MIKIKELSVKLSKVEPSPTLMISAKARELRKEGQDVIDLSIGEPGLVLKTEIKDAGKKAIDDNKNTYTPVAGIPELKRAVIKKLKRDNNLDYKENEIIISTGAKQSLFNLIGVLANPGDEFILIKPYWVSYADQIKYFDAVPVIAECADNFCIRSDYIEQKITEKTKAIILNSPCNPSGAVIEEEELKKISELAVKNDLYVISDEIYEYLIYEGMPKSIADYGEDAKNRTIIINGCSKAYSMTGLRIGYAAGPSNIIKLMENFQSQVTSSPNSVSQYMAVEALGLTRDDYRHEINEFKNKRDIVISELESCGIKTEGANGAFYIFFKIPGDANSEEFCKKLLHEEKLALVPGIAFGMEGYVRISYASDINTIKKGMEKIKRFVKNYQK